MSTFYWIKQDNNLLLPNCAELVYKNDKNGNKWNRQKIKGLFILFCRKVVTQELGKQRSTQQKQKTAETPTQIPF